MDDIRKIVRVTVQGECVNVMLLQEGYTVTIPPPNEFDFANPYDCITVVGNSDEEENVLLII